MVFASALIMLKKTTLEPAYIQQCMSVSRNAVKCIWDLLQLLKFCTSPLVTTVCLDISQKVFDFCQTAWIEILCHTLVALLLQLNAPLQGHLLSSLYRY